MYVGLLGQSNRARSQLVDGPVSRTGLFEGQGGRRRVVLAFGITGPVGRAKPADPVFDVLVLYADDTDDGRVR